MKQIETLFATMAACIVNAHYETGTPGWKTDADGNLEIRDGNPVYVDSQGQEKTMGADAITQLNSQAASFRHRAQEAETSLAEFKDLDPAKARDAIAKLAQIDQKTLVDAGKIDEVRAEITKQYETQMGETQTALSTALGKIDQMTLDNAFNSSDFVAKNIAIPADIFRDSFAKYFEVKDGKLSAKDASGNPIYSNEKFGDPASFDEAVKIIVDQHPQKDQLLLAESRGGSGNDGRGSGNGGNASVLKRADFEAMKPHEKGPEREKVRAGEINFVD